VWQCSTPGVAVHHPRCGSAPPPVWQCTTPGVHVRTRRVTALHADFRRAFDVSLGAEYRQTRLLAEKLFRDYAGGPCRLRGESLFFGTLVHTSDQTRCRFADP